MDKPYLCKGCGAPCKWVEMLHTGKKMLIDLEPEQRIMILEDLPVLTVSNWNPDRAVMVKVYKQHWASCPEAKQFKKQKGESHAPAPRQHGETGKDREQS